MALPPQHRRMGELRAFFDDEPEGAGTRLEKWMAGNDLGWVVDAPADTVTFGQLNGFDVTALLANPRARGPALLYLFHRITLLLDGSPLLIPIDEGWRALEDPIFRGMIETSIRTIRSKGGAIVFITQSPGDIIESGIARVLTEMCPTQFHLANPRGKAKDYVDGFGLTVGEFAALHELQPGQGTFLLRQGAKSAVCQLPMHRMDRFIKVLSAREEDLRMADHGRDEPVIEGVAEEEKELAA
jgi:type IV secretion system protein VirB4